MHDDMLLRFVTYYHSRSLLSYYRQALLTVNLFPPTLLAKRTSTPFRTCKKKVFRIRCGLKFTDQFKALSTGAFTGT